MFATTFSILFWVDENEHHKLSLLKQDNACVGGIRIAQQNLF